MTRAHAGPRGVSAFVAAALRHELERVRLRELLVELADDLGPPDEDMVDEALDAVREVVAASHGRPERGHGKSDHAASA